ncbi:hypothetical protein MSj_02748 [Microcystis aeruginosa Sj]|uniref:Uncharacterized protein n=1 Tax=Microcystis aeruginosa Sj TaxID=1979544 RepID=A0A2Z6UTH9_MICAE|nr:glutamate-cysteine ligase family protein [Microcystis aeruginosa]GBL11246.1 hypothetical protein MSj_02748 [Microcystis aeruginosa Sj]
MNIGIEIELPVVDREGNAASYESVRNLFKKLAERHDFEPYFDSFTTQLIGVRKRQETGWIDVGTDYGFCTLEVAFPPEDGFFSVQTAWNRFMDGVLLPVLAEEELHILGYGCQPKTETPRAKYVAAKGHYRLWDKIVDQHPIHFSFENWPGFASLQFNLDVSPESIVLASNSLIKLSPVIWAWGANSSVSGSKVLSISSLRVEGYRTLAEMNPFFQGRLNFPRRLFASLEDYMLQAWEQPIFEVVRERTIYYPVNPDLSTLEFAHLGEAEFIDLHDRRRILFCEPCDLAQGLIFYWPAVRMKLQLDLNQSVETILTAMTTGCARDVLKNPCNSFIEIRHLPAMSRTETFSWLALFLGCLGDIESCDRLTRDLRLEEVRFSSGEVLTQGWETSLQDRSLGDWGREVLNIATRSLERREPALLPFIEPLARRLQERASPARESVESFDRDGIDGLIEKLKIR